MCTRRYFYRNEKTQEQQLPKASEAAAAATAALSSDEDEEAFSEPDNDNDDDDIDDDKDEFLQDFPYTSSSLDRSSVGSIPWADDAIKQNEIEWDRVESMLNGSMPLPAEETELRNEILDWQRKFPQLLKFNDHNKQQTVLTSLDAQLHNSLSLDSLEDVPEHELFDEDELATPTKQQPQTHAAIRQSHVRATTQTLESGLVSQPANLWQRSNKMQKVSAHTQTLLPYRSSSKPLIAFLPVSSNSANRLRMPPISNVSTQQRRLVSTSTQSFVQLSKTPHAKSAAVTASNSNTTRSLQIHKMLQKPTHAWQCQKPISGRFNNRNSIILPAINLQRIYESSAGANCNSLSTSSSLSSSGQRQQQQQLYIPHKQPNILTNTPSTAGRSISAAVHNPRINGYHVPYSASKYLAFK